MISVSSLLDKLTYDHFRDTSNTTVDLRRSVEGILYHEAMEVIHDLWNQKTGWKFVSASILSSWPRWLSKYQRLKLLTDIKGVYDYLHFFKSNDIILRSSTQIQTEQYQGILDALIYRPYNNIFGEILVREIKRSISLTDPIPLRYKLQLVLYSYGAEKLLEKSIPRIYKGEIVSIDPPILREVDLRNLRESFNQKCKDRVCLRFQRMIVRK